MSSRDSAPRPGEGLDLDGRLHGDPGAFDDFARALRERTPGPRRINADQSTVEQDLGKLVLALVELVRELMERQAIRRVNAGSLSDDEVERMGETFLKLDRRMSELSAAFGVRRDELHLNLGPIRDLL